MKYVIDGFNRLFSFLFLSFVAFSACSGCCLLAFFVLAPVFIVEVFSYSDDHCMFFNAVGKSAKKHTGKCVHNRLGQMLVLTIV